MDIGTQVLLFLFAAIVITPMIVVLSMPLGVLLSPFAALICYLRARSMGLPPGYYARIGALYSTILFLPWIYLIVRMFGKTVPNILIGMGYFVLYTMWALGSILTISLRPLSMVLQPSVSIPRLTPDTFMRWASVYSLSSSAAML